MASVVLIHDRKVYVKSAAVLQIFRLLGGKWKSLLVMQILPGSLLDFMYDWIAKNRYSWFGKQDRCMVPSPEIEDRFID